ncbi:hypothetical protein SP15_039 [Bacillus phage SP-15]|uniref:Uncharacterized protein n=1 Tax=Bacillus phage SP-15 TaxID=1792032 RepID=A0A127AW26_9CAUD|nr:hypothetical protein SP15_039 [Bacillus phage SP-15]AMM44838.1 hypothetical protein SP15_039 [Bacillus phage SP-15]
MGLFTPDNQEFDLLAGFFNEAAHLLGNPVKVKLSQLTGRDFYSDPEYEHSLPKEIDIIFEDNPRVKTLKDLHWYNEDAEVLPVIAYISSKDVNNFNLNPLEGTVVELPYKIGGKHQTSIFEIQEPKGFGPNQVYWVCKLVPYRAETSDKIVEEVKSDSKQDDNFDLIKFEDLDK